MIKQITFFAIGAFLFCSISCAQTTTPPAAAQANQAMQSFFGKNLIKFNFSGLVLQNYMVQYERVINKKQSIALTVSIAPNVSLPFKSTLLSDYGSNSDARRAIVNTTYKKYTATLEYRFYFSGKAPKGLYFAPFARYMNMSQSNVYTFTPSDGKLHTANMHSQFGGFGAGFLIGDQFLIGPHWAIDWWIIGPFYGTTINADFVGTDPQMGDMSAQDLQKVENDIENIKLPLYKTSAVLTPATNTLEAKVKGPYYGIRAFGLCLAYRF
jgi:uncharacterized protein DUF3575